MKWTNACALLGWLSGIALAFPTGAVTIPADTEVHVRLLTQVSSDTPVGQPVQAVVTVPVFTNGQLALASGTKLVGKTTEAKAAKSSTDEGGEKPAELKFTFTQVDDSGGKSKQFFCILVSVDNARESVDSSGLITGIKASETISARIDQGIGKLAERNPQLADLLSGVRSSLLQKVDPSITYLPGTDMLVKLTKPLDWTSTATPDTVGPIEPANALAQLANSEPSRTRAQNPPDPSDLTNLLFIATPEQLQQAFSDAGWSTSAQLGSASRFETARAIIENRGYKEAPMSVLFLNGQPPDFTFQKQNNTFAMRHHIRIWRRPDTFQGKPVWVAAATHDISISFSPEAKTFSHGIDPNIDLERSKVVGDLLFTKSVHGLALVDRTGIPPDPSNATGDHLKTDGKIAVLAF